MIFGLKQTLTYWAPSAEDGYGGKTFSTPITVKGRFEDRRENIYDVHGRLVLSRARFYTATSIESLGYIFLGTSAIADPRNQAGAEEIKIAASTPDISSLKKLYTGYI